MNSHLTHTDKTHAGNNYTGNAFIGKTALVCGASQGIGRAVAIGLAAQGCRILALARSQDKLDILTEELGDSTRGHASLAVDLTNLAALQAQVKNALKSLGPIHIVINNSGGPKAGPLVESEPDAFRAAFEGHVVAATTLAKLVLPGMRLDHYGRFINIISTSVKIPIANLGVSNTIRAAMAAWAKTLANEVGRDGITVNNVLPGFTRTERLSILLKNAAEKSGLSEEEQALKWKEAVPLGRFATAEEVAAAVIFLASPQASYITGVNLPVDGGRTGTL